jgi:hypothetical protein
MNSEIHRTDIPSGETILELINARIADLKNINGFAISTQDIEKLEGVLKTSGMNDEILREFLSVAKLNSNAQSDAIGISTAYGVGRMPDEIMGILKPTTPGVHVSIPCSSGPELVSKHSPESSKVRLTLGEAGGIDENNRVFGEAVLKILSETNHDVARVINNGTHVVVNTELNNQIEALPLAGKDTAIYQNLISLPADQSDEGSPHGVLIMLEGDIINLSHIAHLFDNETSLGFGGLICVHGNITTTVNKGGPDHDVKDKRELEKCVVTVKKYKTQELGTITQDPDMITSRGGHAHFFNCGHFLEASGKVFVLAWPFAGKITTTYKDLTP